MMGKVLIIIDQHYIYNAARSIGRGTAYAAIAAAVAAGPGVRYSLARYVAT